MIISSTQQIGLGSMTPRQRIAFAKQFNHGVPGGKATLTPDTGGHRLAHTPSAPEGQRYSLARGEKALTTDSAMYGPTHPWDVCMRNELGYAIWNLTSPTLFEWLRPFFTPNQNFLKVPVWDFRNQTTQPYGSTDVWCHAVSCTGNVIRGCSIDYCFDPNHHYFACRQDVEPRDLQNVCFRLPQINVDGQLITNVDDWERVMMYKRMAEVIRKTIITDNAYAPSGDNQTPEDGLKYFFINFLPRHPELTGNCAELAPVTVDLTGVALADIPEKIHQRIRFIEGRIRFIKQDANWRSNDSDWALVMNPLDAECLLDAQTCVQLCNSYSIALPIEFFTASGRNVFYQDYVNMLYGGMFGGGFIKTKEGKEISIMRDYGVPRGEFYLLYRGWDGAQYAMSLAINDWTPWLNIYNRRSPLATITSLANGTVLNFVVPGEGGCLSEHIRWNWRYFSTEPWAQTRFTNFDDLDECTVVDPAWSAFPDVEHATACDQVAVVPD